MLKTEKRKAKWIAFLFLSVSAVLWLVPLIWILSTSLKPESEAISWPPSWIPETWTLDNYRDVLTNTEETPVLRWFGNSVLIAVLHTALVLAVDIPAAYAYARMEFKGKEFIFWSLMATMMIPSVILYIPLYAIIDRLGWVDTPWAMIFPGAGGVFGIFLLRQFFRAIPVELEEAARIDGASSLQILWHVILPVSRPAIATVGLFTFLTNWNDFLWPLIVTNDAQTRTLPVGLSILQGTFNIQYAHTMAAAVMSALPAMLLFMATQRFFMKSGMMSGIKG